MVAPLLCLCLVKDVSPQSMQSYSKDAKLIHQKPTLGIHSINPLRHSGEFIQPFETSTSLFSFDIRLLDKHSVIPIFKYSYRRFITITKTKKPATFQPQAFNLLYQFSFNPTNILHPTSKFLLLSYSY